MAATSRSRSASRAPSASTKTRRKPGAPAARKRNAPARKQRDKKGRPGGTARLLWFGLAGLVLLAAWMYPVVRMHYQESRKLASLKAEYQSVATRNKTLKAEVEGLKTPAGIERAARESLGLVHQGENAYVVMEPKKATTRTAETRRAASDDGGLGKLLDYLFGVK
jgi:cell division protein FtsB